MEGCNMHEVGFLTGMKKQTIPWGSLVKNPSSWINEECIPHGFQWKDPSKIQMGEIFRLLDHWRDRKDQGLDHLIWVPTCALFQSDDMDSEDVLDVQHPTGHQDDSSSDEEMFAFPQSDGSSDNELFNLPQSDDINQMGSDSRETQHSDASTADADLSDDRESIDVPVQSLTVPISHPDEYRSSEYDTHRVTLSPSVCLT